MLTFRILSKLLSPSLIKMGEVSIITAFIDKLLLSDIFATLKKVIAGELS